MIIIVLFKPADNLNAIKIECSSIVDFFFCGELRGGKW